MPTVLLSISALCLLLFSFGLWCLEQQTVILAKYQAAIGLCNAQTATAFRLLSPVDMRSDEGSFLELQGQSQVHMILVALTVLLTLLAIVEDWRTRPQWRAFTGGILILTLVGVAAASQCPESIGVWERLSVYAIQLWTLSQSINSLYELRQQNVPTMAAEANRKVHVDELSTDEARFATSSSTF